MDSRWSKRKKPQVLGLLGMMHESRDSRKNIRVAAWH
jgi:hypothetical protein